MKKEELYSIRLVFVDFIRDEFITIGGAHFKNEKEQRRNWQVIPSVEVEDSSSADGCFLADLMGEDGIMESKHILAETCEMLLGNSIHVLIEQGRNETSQMIEKARAYFKSKHNTLRGEGR